MSEEQGTSSPEQGNSVAVSSSGGIFVTGSTWGSLDGNTNSGQTDMFLVKYDSSGLKQWTRQLGSSSGNADEGNGVAIDSSGNVFIVGTTYGSLDGGTFSGSADMFLVKYDSSGSLQ